MTQSKTKDLHTPARHGLALPLLLGLFIMANLFMAIPRTFAATITVNSSDDELNTDGDCSFREAVSSAETNVAVDTCTAGDSGTDTVDLSSVSGTITVTGGDLAVTEGLTIQGPGSDNLTLQGDSITAQRLFNFTGGNSSVVLSISGLTLSSFGDLNFNGGFGNGATILVNSGTLDLNDIIVYSSWGADAGAIYAENGSILDISNSTFIYGSSTTGGAIYSNGATVTIDQSNFNSNNAEAFYMNGGTATITNSTFNGNTFDIDGGSSISVNGNGTLNLTDTIIQNANFGGRGTVYVFSGSQLTMTGGSISNNTNTEAGTSALSNFGTATLTNVTIDQNTSSLGASVENGGTLTFQNVTVSSEQGGNTVSGGGWGILQSAGTLNLLESRVTDNVNGKIGGGIYQGGGTLNIKQSLIDGNTTSQLGAGLYVTGAGSNTNIINSTITNNGSADGGGMYVDNGTVELYNVTLSGNTATTGTDGGNITQSAGSLTITNTLLSKGVTGQNCKGTVTDGGNNLQYGDSTCTGITEATIDPLDGTGLADNGGSTLTIALAANSEALDTADSTVCTDANTVNSIDQRGEVRPSGSGCDIGAFEVQVVSDVTAPTITNVTSSTSDGTYTADDIILLEITFDEAVTVTGTPQITLETGTTDAVVDYTSGSGTDTLVFTYTVAAGENSADLDYVATSSLSLNGGTIQDAAANDADLTLPAPAASGSLSANKALIIDTQAPTLATITEVSPDPTTDTTPNFTFSSDEAGTITYGGSCSSATTDASAGNNTITFSTLALGTYADCTITVTDAVGNASDPLAVGSFTITEAENNDNNNNNNNNSTTTTRRRSGGGTGGVYRSNQEIKATETTTTTTTPTKVAREKISFEDIKDHPYEKEILEVAKMCNLRGYPDELHKQLKNFKPDQPITRGELLTMLMKCKYNTLPKPKKLTYQDVNFKHPAVAYIEKGTEIGIVQGYPDETFKPDQYTIFAEALKMIELNWVKMEVIDTSPVSEKCSDLDQQQWYAKYYNYGLNNTMLDENVSPLCNPGKDITRGEVAYLIYHINDLDASELRE